MTNHQLHIHNNHIEATCSKAHACNIGIANSGAGRKYNQQQEKSSLQFGRDKQRWSFNLKFNKIFSISCCSGGTEF
jgi:hypothetical protein